jgi:stringent starvation protein B
MTSTRPYLLRALYDWIVDNDLTPHVLVDAEAEDVEVPQQFVEDGKIVLNITPNAVKDLNIGNEYLSFNARFAGKPQHILSPISAVLAIYAKENGEGMAFPEEIPDEKPEHDESELQKTDVKPRPTLKVVK